MATSQFDNIFHGLSPDPGKIRFAQSGLAWKALQGEQTATVAASNIKWAQWLRVARNFQLRVALKDNRHRETFDGFQREDHDKLVGVFKSYYDVALESKDISYKGWNWGTTDFQGEDLAFLVSNKTAFEVPMRYVANSNIAGKTEVSVEFAPLNANGGNKTAKTGKYDELVEMRFYVPGVVERAADDDDDEDKEKEKERKSDDDEEQSAAQVFHDAIRDRAEIGQGIMGESIVLFEDVLVVTPRGRYDIDMFTDFMRLRGKTYDYKIMYSAINRLFLLPKADDVHVQFIIGLDPPIRQGQTKYPYLVTMFSRDQELEIDLALDDETINTKYEGRLDKHYETAMYQVVSSVFRGLTNKKITGTSSYQSVGGHPSIKCNLKASQGELFVLEKALFFVTKQPTLIEFADIHQVVFSRLGGGMASARTIDVKVVKQTGPELVFTSMNKEEHEGLEAFLKGKKVKTKNEMGDDLIAAALDDADEDEEMQSVASDDEAPARPRMANDDDEDSEEDEDFQASSSDSGSPSDTSGSDSDAASDASDDMVKAAKAKASAKAKSKAEKKKKSKEGSPGGSPPKKKKKKASAAADGETPKKKKKKKSTGGTADEPMDVDADEPAVKSKPKPKPKVRDGEQDEPAKKKQKRASD